MEESVRNFHLEEYKQLKEEMSGLLSRIETLARLGLIVAAAVFSWLAVQGFSPGATENSWCVKLPKSLFMPAWFIPFAFSLLSGLAAFAAYWRGRQMASYLRRLESEFAAEGLGWESTLERKRPILTQTAAIYWFVLVAGTFVAGVAGTVSVSAANDVCAMSKSTKVDS